MTEIEIKIIIISIILFVLLLIMCLIDSYLDYRKKQTGISVIVLIRHKSIKKDSKGTSIMTEGKKIVEGLEKRENGRK